MTQVLLFIEDALSEAVGRAILSHCGLEASFAYAKGGNGYLRSKTPQLNKSAAHVPVVMFTDRDTSKNCPPQLIKSWLGSEERNANFVLRVAEMETESWVMADDEQFAAYFGIAQTNLSHAPDTLPDPKKTLIEAVRRSKNSTLKADVLPAKGSTALIGPAYNRALTTFVEARWRAAHAAQKSPSLKRALTALGALASRLG